MHTYSEYIQITSNKLIIKFPPDFYRGRALLEITPLAEELTVTNSNQTRRENFRKLLLQRPSSIKKEEIQEFKKISNWIREWKQEES